MGRYDYATGDIPCYSQLAFTGDLANAVGTNGSGLLLLLGYQDYLLARPPSTAVSTLANRLFAVRGRNAALTVTSEDLSRDAATLELRALALAPERVVDGGPSMVLVAEWPTLVPIGPPDHWIVIRRIDGTHAEIGDPCWNGLGADWAARRWTPKLPPKDVSLYGATRRIPLARLAPLLRPGAVFRLAPA